MDYLAGSKKIMIIMFDGIINFQILNNFVKNINKLQAKNTQQVIAPNQTSPQFQKTLI